MHIQVINFQLKGVSESDYANLSNQLAPAFADVPGLEHKVWIANSDTGTYGGVYVWRDRQAMEDFAQTELFNSVATHPNLEGLTSTDFGVLEGPTGVTRGMFVPG
jgi:heme-degrading monooxygenase HmoA